METKMRLVELNKKQVDLVQPLSERGMSVSPSELSLAINGRAMQEKHKKILEAVNEILTEWEEKK